jgi:hypothetical protein
MAFKEEDTEEVNKKPLALEMEKNNTVNRAMHNSIVTCLQNHQRLQKETVGMLQKEISECIPDQKERRQHIKCHEAHEGDASQDSAATLLGDYVQEKGCLGDIKTELVEVQNKKYGQKNW